MDTRNERVELPEGMAYCPVCFGTTRNPDDDGNPCAWCQATGVVPEGSKGPWD